MGDFLPDLTVNTGNTDSPSNAPGNSYTQQILYWTNAAYLEGKRDNEDSAEIKGMSDAFDYLSGLQWKGPQPAHRSKPVSNRVLSLFWETIGLLTDIRPIWEVKAAQTGVEVERESYSKAQDILNNLTKAWALKNDFDLKMAFWIMFSMLGTGYCKVWWDPYANGNDPLTDGDIAMDIIPPNGVFVLGGDGDIQKAECVIYRKVRTLAWIKRYYPLTGHLVRPDISTSQYEMNISAPPHLSPQLFMSLSPGMKRKIGQGKDLVESVYPEAEVKEFWIKDDMVNGTGKTMLMGRAGTNWCYQVKPGEPCYPRGRVIVTANDVILDDQPNPNWDRKVPISKLRIQAVPWQAQGFSFLKPLMQGQDIINQVLGGLLNMVKKALSPQLMAPKNALSADAWKNIDTSRPNEKILFSPNSPHMPKYSDPPNVPSYVLQLEGIIEREMNRFSGVSAIDSAMSKKQVPSGDSLEQITNAKNTPIRLMSRFIEGGVSEVGQFFVSRSLQFYTAERRLELLGTYGLMPQDYDTNQGSLVPEGMRPETYVRRFHFNIERGSLLKVQHMERVTFAFKMYQLKLISRVQFFKMVDINVNQEQNTKELIEEAKVMAQFAPPAKGKK